MQDQQSTSKSTLSGQAKGQKNEEIYYVQRILDKTIISGKMHYLVKWDGYSDEESTWEPEENLTPEIIGNFERSLFQRGLRVDLNSLQIEPQIQRSEVQQPRVPQAAQTSYDSSQQLKKLDKIIGMYWNGNENQKFCIVTFRDDDKTKKSVKYEFMKKYYPHEVIRYFEKHIQFVPK